MQRRVWPWRAVTAGSGPARRKHATDCMHAASPSLDRSCCSQDRWSRQGTTESYSNFGLADQGDLVRDKAGALVVPGCAVLVRRRPRTRTFPA